MSETAIHDGPYIGLIPYEEKHAQFFFGRESEREIITANLMAWHLTLLYGASGVGKSSVLQAGVVHNLRRLSEQHLAKGSAPEFAVSLFSSWRDDPLVGLRESILNSVSLLPGRQAIEPRSDSASLVDVIKTATENVSGRLLIILDQFEEYFLYHGQEDGEGTFAVEFPRAVAYRQLRVNFLISIREDALAKLDRFEDRIPNLFSNYLRIEHLNRPKAREAIVEPINQYNRLRAVDGGKVSIDQALVETVLDQVKTGRVFLGDTGRGGVEAEDSTAHIETPYLQMVMTRLWTEEMRAGSRRLRLETLTGLGGAQSVVWKHLDEAMGWLSADERDVALRVFHYLVTPSGTKIAYPIADLAEYGGLKEEQLVPVLEKLSVSRILRPLAPPHERPESLRYEIFHDVLAPAILDWRSRYADGQKRAETERQLEIEAQERARAEQRLAREQMLVRRQRWGLVVMAIMLLIMIGTVAFAFQQQNLAERSSNAAKNSQAATEAALAYAEISKAQTQKALTAAESERTAAESERTAAEAARDTAKRAQGAAESQRSLAERARAEANTQRLAAESATAEVARQRDNLERARKDLQERNRDLGVAIANGEDQRLIGQSRELAAIATSHLKHEPELSLLLATEAFRKKDTDEAKAAVRKALLEPYAFPVIRGHAGAVSSAEFSPDGKYVVTASVDNTARVWDANTGEDIAELRGHRGSVLAATFSPDGKYIVTASDDNTARLWNVNNFQNQAELRGHKAAVNSAAFSPDSKYVVTASNDATVRVWDVSTGSCAAEMVGHTAPVRNAAFSPDGRYVVTASYDQSAQIWYASSGGSRYYLPHTNSVSKAAFSADGRYVVTASNDKRARVWDTNTGKLRIELLHTDAVLSATFSPDGKYVLTASDDNTARLWDLSTGEIKFQLRGHTGIVRNAIFSPDGQYVITASEDGTAQIWDASSGKPITQMRGHSDSVLGVAFSFDGKRVVTAGNDHTARVWGTIPDVPTGGTLPPGPGSTVPYFGQSITELRGHRGVVRSASFSPDGKYLVTASDDHTARLLNLGTKESVELRGHTDSVLSAAFSPDGKYVATASGDKTARIWDPNALDKPKELVGHTDTVWSAAFSHTGEYLVTASEDETARVWNLNTGTSETLRVPVVGGPTDLVAKAFRSAAFSYDGESIVTANVDGMARIWNVRTKEIVTELRGHKGVVWSASFSPDGKRLVTGGADGTARIWDAPSGKSLFVLRGHEGAVLSVAFSSNSKYVATAGADKTVRLWDADTGEPARELRGQSSLVWSVAFSADGKYVVTGSDDKTARIYVCEVCGSAGDQIELALKRVTRQLTPAERERYLREPLDK